MNKHLHRVVFNAARGMRIVVQETARSTGKASGPTPVLVGTALASLLVAIAAQAQIVGAPGAAPGLRPTVLLAPNGVPLVNIQTPSAAGVSRNLYNQFDVQPRGVILNNSRTDVQTQLGGWVQANPFLATGPARIILNEVVSGNPTQLRGAIEVGGQRAEVIVANPSGIAVDGATFINASRATLTTGTPQLNALGGLEGYVVRGGTVSIDGAGLDARSTDYAAILARAIKVNAALWANELKVVTGANQVSPDQGQVSPTTGTGKAPVFALDLAHLGGMYAGKITLIGTEHGVGARNAGTIMAADGSGPLSGPGEFIITADGRLENIGTIQAARRAAIGAESLANSGRITSGGELKIATQGALGNTGGTLEAQSLQLASGSDIDNRGGTMRQTSGVGLTINAPILSNTAGGVIGAELLPETPAQPGTGTGIDGTGTSNPATPSTGIETGTGSSGGSGSGGSATSASPSDMPVPAPGTITAAGSILNDAGRVYVGGPIHLQTPQVDNNSGSLTTTSLTASGPSFRNAGGTVNVAGSFTAHVDRFDNTGGTVRAGNRGVIDGVVTRIDAGTLTNIGTGRIYGDRISIGAGTLNNLAETVNGVTSAGTIAARARLDIGAQTISNRGGSLIFSAGDLAIGGSLDADGRATGAAAALGNHASTIEATGNAGIGAAVLNNTNDGVTWALQPGTSEHRVEYAVPGSATHYPASEVLLAAGGNLPIVSIDNAGWSNWVATDASNPLAPGSNAAARLLLPSPDYPLERFRAYYLQSPANSADRSFRTCNVDTCETTAMPGAWYAISDPIWATFGVAPPPADLPATHPGRIDPHIAVGQEGLSATVDGPSGPTTVMLQRFDHPVTQAEYEQWQAYRAAHEALDVATLGFIHTITGVVRGPEGDKPPRLSSIYDAFDYTVTGSTAVLQSSAPGKILAGGAMNIDVGSGTNDMSQILAGGALTITGGTIANVGLVVDAPTVQTGTAIHSYVQNDRRTYQFAPYDLTTYSTVTLAAARQEGSVSFAGSGADAGSLALGQTGASTQGAGSVQGTRVNPIVQVPSAVGGTGAIGASASGAIPLVVRTSTPNTTVPTASLFRTHPEPGSRYLVETDPRFANQRQWLSSDYLLTALGSDPDLVQKRLGDGFYEQRLIREQVAQLTGYRLLDGFESDDAQYAALMSAGVTFAQAYGLRPGVALTAAQMAQLTSDIVWLVEQEVSIPCPSGSVADGCTQKVLVPQVYVRVREGDIDGSGALLAGRSVDMRLAGDLTTAGGTIAGRETVVISAENINNLAGRITGQDALLMARQDLNVIGGTIDAGNSLGVIAGRDINVVSTTRDSHSSSRSDSRMLLGSDAAGGVKLAAVTLDRVAGLYVTNPGGSLLAAAGRDMNLVGAEVKSAGDAALAAGRDMNLDTVTTGRAEDIRWSGRNSRDGQQSRETGTTVSGAGSVSLQAGRDLTGRAATLSAGQTLSLDAGGTLALYAGEDQTSGETHHATKKGMTKYSLDADSQETSLARTTLDATGIRLRSGGDMTLSAIDAKAGSLAIDAGGKLSLLTQSTTSAMSRKEVDNDAAFSSSSGSGRTDETSHHNRFAAEDLSLQAARGVKAQLGQNDSLSALAQQPGMAWVNQLANDPAFVNSVEWQRVKEEHDRWSYHQSGMGPVTALVVSVVAAAVAAPMAAQAGAAAGGAATSAGMGATVSAGTSAAVQAGVSALASRAAVSLVNNDGDLGRVIEEMGSSEAVKGIATSMLTAGVIEGLGNTITMDVDGVAKRSR